VPVREVSALTGPHQILCRNEVLRCLNPSEGAKMFTGYPKYDIAISFLYQDPPFVQALYDKLRTGLEVFFFPGNPEVLAGTDGLESMRAPERQKARISANKSSLCRGRYDAPLLHYPVGDPQERVHGL
jgi:hypothetical protein